MELQFHPDSAWKRSSKNMNVKLSVGCLNIWPIECTDVFRRVLALNKDFTLTSKAQCLLYVSPVLTPTEFVPVN
jgi:hypothetical protein